MFAFVQQLKTGVAAIEQAAAAAEENISVILIGYEDAGQAREGKAASSCVKGSLWRAGSITSGGKAESGINDSVGAMLLRLRWHSRSEARDSAAMRDRRCASFHHVALGGLCLQQLTPA